MEQLQEVLSYIINHRLFASSPTAFGKLFSENDRNRGIRIIKGVTKNFDSTLQKFEEKFALSAIGLQQLVEADKLANVLFRSFPDECEENELKEYGNQLLIALMQEKYKELPEEFSEYIDAVEEMRYQQREQYLWFLALFFIKYGMYRIYHSHFEKDYYSAWEDLSHCFKDKFPNRYDLHSIVSAYTATDIYCDVCHPSVWGLVQHLVPILDIAENPDKREERLRSFHLFDWGMDSYWRKPDASFVFGESDIWWFYVVDTKIPNNGFYTVIHIKSGQNKDSYNLVEVYNLFFIKIDDFEGYSYLAHLCKTNDLESVTLGVANYDETIQTLSVEFDDDVDFPASLQLIDLNAPNGKEDKVWKNIVEYFKVNFRHSILKQVKNRMGITFMDDEFEVVDVVIGRKEMFVGIKELLLPNQPVREYSLDLDKHEALKCIHPSDDACVIRRNEDGKLYIAWLEKDLQIMLK